MKVWTDASCDDSEDIFGIGYVIILKSGAEITGKHYQHGDYTSMEAEYFALMEALQIAKESMTEYDNEIDVVTDCKPLVDKIREPDDLYDDRWFEYRRHALNSLFDFEKWDLYWEERSNTEQNEEANRLAREAMWQGRDDDSTYGGNAVEGVSYTEVV